MNSISPGKSPFRDLNIRTELISLDLSTRPTCEATRQGQTDCVERLCGVQNRSASRTMSLMDTISYFYLRESYLYAANSSMKNFPIFHPLGPWNQHHL